ncbi:MAG: PEP-CTERM sorting domain-containing protein [Planctomycetaceae bacterium]|nr:PEP-CTERM sorting domain-containing protein [Planctomycetaceae bacterium]
MKKLITVFAIVLIVSVIASAADVAGWNAFVIRNSNSGAIAPTIADVADGFKQFDVQLSGQKAGWGTNSMNELTIGDIEAVSIEGVPSGVYGPYMNIWVTDGLGGYAVLSNEPSHTLEWGTSGPHNTIWDILQDATTWVYEVSGTQGFKLPNGTTTYANLPAGTTIPHFTFSDFAGYTIATPSSHWGGGGAPDDLNAGTYTAYGFNWIFGDTDDNYSNIYTVKNPTLVPEPTTMAILGLGALSLIRRKK